MVPTRFLGGISGDFGSREDRFFIKIMGHCKTCLKNLDPGVGARFRRHESQKLEKFNRAYRRNVGRLAGLVISPVLSPPQTRFLHEPSVLTGFQKAETANL